MSERIVAAGAVAMKAKAIGNPVGVLRETGGTAWPAGRRIRTHVSVAGSARARWRRAEFPRSRHAGAARLDIYRAVGDAKVRFDDETQAQIFDVGQKLAEINKVEASSAAADEFPRSIKLGELRARSNGCAPKSAHLDPGEPGARNAGDLARLAMLHWGGYDVVGRRQERRGHGAATLIYADQQRADAARLCGPSR